MKYLLLIAIIILAVGCGGKDESTTETKPVEEKVVEVNEEAKTEEPLAETTPELEGVNYEELKEREGIYYLLDPDDPYTGKSFTLWQNGQKEMELNFKDGKKDGLWVLWHENGKKRMETNWKDGKEEGLKVGWHENDKKEREFNYKEGEPDGLWTVWWKNGQKQSETIWKDGIPVSGKEWNEKGNRF